MLVKSDEKLKSLRELEIEEEVGNARKRCFESIMHHVRDVEE